GKLHAVVGSGTRRIAAEMSMSLAPRRRVALTGLIPFLFPAGVAAADPAADIDAVVRDALKAWRVPAVAVAVVRKDPIVCLKGHGLREIGTDRPVTPDTVFPLASCTKGFTTTLLAMLVDDGRLRWDDPVRKHLDWFQLADALADRDVTLRDLVTHRTGLRGHETTGIRSPWRPMGPIARAAFRPTASHSPAPFHNH